MAGEAAAGSGCKAWLDFTNSSQAVTVSQGWHLPGSTVSPVQELNKQRPGDPASWRLWEKRLSSGRWGVKPWLFSSRLASRSILRVDLKGIKTGFARKPALSHLEKTGSLCSLSTCGETNAQPQGF